MSLWLKPEINNPKPGAILFIGRDPGTNEMAELKPFVGQAGWLLNSLLAQAGIDRNEVNITNLVQTQPAGNDFRRHNSRDVERGIAESKDLVRRLRPNLIVTFGNEASYAFAPDWPSKTGDIWGAYGIQERRGYLWLDEQTQCKVLTTIHPAACLVNRDPSGVSEMLLLKDLERARDDSKTSRLVRKIYRIVVGNSNNIDSIVQRLAVCNSLACDIECHNSELTACIGFAPNSSEAFIFTPKHFYLAHKLLVQKNITKIFHNAQFDLYHLLSRDNVRVEGRIDDTMIAWHCLWPEIASQKESRNKKQGTSKRTHKSLAFLDSIYGSSPEWWKDYEFSDDAEMYELNGIDCCKTFDFMEQMNEEIDQVGVRRIYEHERKLVWPVVDIQHRGLLVDMAAREEALKKLGTEEESLSSELTQLIEPLLLERRDLIERPNLFWSMKTCKCCGNGKKKKAQCWSCQGYEEAPSKALLVADYGKHEKATKDDYYNWYFKECAQCSGQGQWETFNYNPGSDDQTKEILYNVLKLPKRMSKGSLTSNEEALKSILGAIQ